jgi:hypothetical protein
VREATLRALPPPSGMEKRGSPRYPSAWMRTRWAASGRTGGGSWERTAFLPLGFGVDRRDEEEAHRFFGCDQSGLSCREEVFFVTYR